MSDASIRPAKIARVLPESIASELGFEPGDAIVAINGQRPQDLIDYQFLCSDEILAIEVLDTAGQLHHLELEKETDDDLGLEFETALFDGLIQCNNRCPFCFIDQQPPGKRNTLYLKDDDYRLSFLYGSYLTLTNLTASQWQRIERLRLSPLYVSVHATDPQLRARLLKNPRAGAILDQLHWLQARRLQIHAQVVVCPGINDGDALEKTLLDLAAFGQGEVPTVISTAVVPVGLTRFRPGLDELIAVDEAKASETIDRVQRLQTRFLDSLGTRFAWLADEWFLIARRPLPPASTYEDYPQLGNGIGSIRQFLEAFESAAWRLLPSSVAPDRRLSWVVGNAVEVAFQPLVAQLNQVEGLEVRLAPLGSPYWGQRIAVTGLLTGEDLLVGLDGSDLGDGILLPSLMLEGEQTRFLDDMTVDSVARKLDVPIYVVEGVEDLLKTCIQ